MKFIAFCTKGLEKIVEQEILFSIKDAQIIETGNKRVVFESEENFDKLTNLKTVDDLGLLQTSANDITSIEKVVTVLKTLTLENTRQLINAFRAIHPTDFSITVSIVGTSFSASELVREVSDTITKKYNWTFAEFDHANFDIRLFIDTSKMYTSVRLTKESLQHRSYKSSSRIGSLKPTIAAAMVLMAIKDKTGLRIVDNFCGSGTILCEALLANNNVYGGDIDTESVIATRNNLRNAGSIKEERIKQLDATKTNWQNNFFDCAISNLPWDKQIKVSSITDLYIGTLQEYARILKPEGSLCLLVSKPEILIKHAKKIFSNKQINTYKISLLGQTPSIIFIT